ncbi:hypothetical protein INT46_010611 [Mucor plumbeus]|uniref:SNRNP25 ubiquitin-like domain-containing protein n=1 Tax=Mucor plumbeus TaxID=97098 RepID=A0A8H7RJM4_9FUNG|nr:hypothetical protein INT46_010611 [Mucor plumbeus]
MSNLPLPHPSVIDELQLEINTILKQDEILSDISAFATIEELEALLAIEKGQAYNITIERLPLPPIDIIVHQSSTIQEIKRLIKLYVNRQSSSSKKISWKYIWRSHCLEFQNAKLLNDAAVVSQLGIKQNSILKFARLSHEQGQHRKAWHRNP